MLVIRGRASLAAAGGGSNLRAPALAIGNFDGVHRGHQALLARARGLAQARGAHAGVLTFDPHPARYFAPRLAPPMITTLARRLELIEAAGLDFAIVEPFDAALAALEPEAFVTGVLAREIGARDVVVGYDFSFGRGRRGTPALLTTLGAGCGVSVDVVPAVSVDGVTCSSTKIREFVLEGRVEGAALLLGRPFELEGTVVRGAARGRTIGFPTANLAPTTELAPRAGIYAGRARTAQGTFGAAISVGTNPTFGAGQPVTVEAYLLDFSGDLYDAPLRLELVAWLREERRFDSIDALVAQIGADVARTRAVLAS